jgi:pimeloyl-ACP methyl ester carboxylesterase
MIPLLIPNPEHLERVLNDPVKCDNLLEAAKSLALASHRQAGSQNDIFQITHMSEIPVADINVPILVIAGTGDDLTEDAEYISQNNSNTHLILVEGGDHSTFTVFSDELVPHMIEFMRTPAPGK